MIELREHIINKLDDNTFLVSNSWHSVKINIDDMDLFLSTLFINTDKIFYSKMSCPNCKSDYEKPIFNSICIKCGYTGVKER